MKGKFALLLALMLFFGVFSASVTAPSTKTIDGDPSDWTGTPGADNSWSVSAGEGIWRDIAQDDTGNGSVIYPNCTHSSPLIIDYAGAPWTGPPTEALAYPDKYVAGTEPFWYKHGGMVDLKEFRVTADSSNLYILLRFENMGSQEIAVEWNKEVHTSGSGANDTNFGKILAQVYIDKDRVLGSGRTDATMQGNFEFDPLCAWEVVLNVAGDVLRGYPNVQLADGTTYYHNVSADCYADCDIYPSAIEMKVPFSEIGDPRGKTWRFVVVAGGFDEGKYRYISSTKWLTVDVSWMALFHFAGQAGEWWGLGNDSNIVDMAFTASKAEQEALLNSFSSLVVIDKYRDVHFSDTGDVSTTLPVGGFIRPLDKLALMAPWIALAVVAIAATSVVYRRKHITKTI